MVMSGERIGMDQNANTIIIQMSADSDDIKDLYRGKGKLFKKIKYQIEEIKNDSSEVDEKIQPIIVIFKQKGLLG